MCSITITLGQLLIAIVIFLILIIAWYKIDKHKWNHGICKCNKGNYKYFPILYTKNKSLSDIIAILLPAFTYKCENCGHKIKINLFFDKITKNYTFSDIVFISYFFSQATPLP